MKFSISIVMDNAAFNEEPHELSRILRRAADRLERYPPEPGVGFRVMDINGNHVGDAKITK